MILNRLNFLFLGLIFSNQLIAQTVLLDEKFTTGIPTTWTLVDADGETPVSSVSHFTEAWIHYVSVFDTCAASTSYYEDTSKFSQDYLITPRISLESFGNLLFWDAKSLDGSYPDGYEVLISTTDSLPSSFTPIKIIDSESPYWKSYQINLSKLGYADQDIFIAFKNHTKNGFILQIDNVRITSNDPLNIIENEISISIYPNPVVDILTIETDNFIQFSIYDMTGKLVGTYTDKNISLADLNSGLYLLKIDTQEGILTRKIFKL